jgi:hypothetical protein
VWFPAGGEAFGDMLEVMARIAFESGFKIILESSNRFKKKIGLNRG